MNISSTFKRASVGLATLLVGLSMTVGTVHAIPYTGDTTVASPAPAFNVFTGNMPSPAPAGGESDFFQSRVPANGDLSDSHTAYTDPTNADCTDGKVIQLHVYVHNGASADHNDGGNGSSVAHGTKVRVSLPGTQASSFGPTATISASNAGTVTDGATINCNGKSVKLQYISGSASQYSIGSGVLPLSDAIIGNGVPIQSHNVAGDVWGCWNERVYVVLAVKVVAAPPVATPIYTCDAFNITADVKRNVKVSTFATTATNGAVFKNAVLKWGDNSLAVTTANVVGQSHQYNADGTYKITTIAHFTVNGQDVTADGPNCEQSVTFTSGKPPHITPPIVTPPTTGTPSTLVNTGAGSVIGIFAAATAAGAAAYRFVLARRLTRQ